MPVVRGVLIAALFGFVLIVMIPIYVPRPAFIPGFAPPPDMWPRTVSIVGLVLGLIALLSGWLRTAGPREPDEETDWEMTAPAGVLLGRFALAVVVFGAFLTLTPWIGFLAASILLTGATIWLTGNRGRRLWAVGIAILAPACLLFFFSYALGTQFPEGRWLQALGF